MKADIERLVVGIAVDEIRASAVLDMRQIYVPIGFGLAYLSDQTPNDFLCAPP